MWSKKVLTDSLSWVSVGKLHFWSPSFESRGGGGHIRKKTKQEIAEEALRDAKWTVTDLVKKMNRAIGLAIEAGEEPQKANQRVKSNLFSLLANELKKK